MSDYIKPPPPLPPPFPIKKDCVSNSLEVKETEEEAVKYILKLRENMLKINEGDPVNFTYTHIEPIIQEGPTCGLVALGMISSMNKKTLEISDILNLARSRGFSKKGEMFSAFWMTKLAQQILGDKFKISLFTDGLEKNKDYVLKSLHSGSIFLVPYDADKNHSPANLKGHKAHWAVLCGAIEYSQGTYVLARQGKSKYVAIWNYSSLHKSNINLSEISYLRQDQDDYVIDDISKSLAGNFIQFVKI